MQIFFFNLVPEISWGAGTSARVLKRKEKCLQASDLDRMISAAYGRLEGQKLSQKETINIGWPKNVSHLQKLKNMDDCGIQQADSSCTNLFTNGTYAQLKRKELWCFFGLGCNPTLSCVCKTH